MCRNRRQNYQALDGKGLSKWLGLELPFLTPSVTPPSAVSPIIAPVVSKRSFAPLLRRYYSTKRPGEDVDANFTVKTSNAGSTVRSSNRAVAMYSIAALVAVGGLSYAAVPLYKMFCAATGYAGTTKVAGTYALISLHSSYFNYNLFSDLGD